MNLICFLSEALGFTEINDLQFGQCETQYQKNHFLFSLSNGEISHIALISVLGEGSSPMLLSNSCYSTSIRNPWSLKTCHSTTSLFITPPISVINHLLIAPQIWLRILAPNSHSFSPPQILLLSWTIHQCYGLKIPDLLSASKLHLLATSPSHSPCLHPDSPFFTSMPPLKA